MAKKVVIEKESTVYRIRETLSTWRAGLIQAENVEYPNRVNLYRTYRDVLLDGHLTGIINLLSHKISRTKFNILSGGNINKRGEKLFKKKWFYDFLKYYIEQLFWGHSLVQIDGIENGNIIGVSLINRFYVRPETNEILNDLYSIKGTQYNPNSDWLIDIGGKRDLGLLQQLSPLALMKKATFAYWNEFSEVFGTPFRVVHTKSDNVEDRQRLEKMLQDQASAGYAIMDKDDTIDLLDTKRSDASDVYSILIELLNKEMSKVVLGSTEIVDGGSGGSEARATVHNEQFNQKIMSILTDIEFFVNETVVPKLKRLGIIGDVELSFVNEENLSMVDKVKIDEIVSKLVSEGNIDRTYIEETYKVKLNEVIEDEQEEEVEDDNNNEQSN